MIGVKVSTRDWRPAEISRSHHRYFRKPETHSHVEDRIDDDKQCAAFRGLFAFVNKFRATREKKPWKGRGGEDRSPAICIAKIRIYFVDLLVSQSFSRTDKSPKNFISP